MHKLEDGNVLNSKIVSGSVLVGVCFFLILGVLGYGNDYLTPLTNSQIISKIIIGVLLSVAGVVIGLGFHDET